MKYPEHIYRKFEIVEKEILGETFYGIIEYKKLFGLIEYKKQLKLNVNPFDKSLVSLIGVIDNTRWVASKSGLKRAIDECHRWAEYDFLEKMTR